MHEISLVRTIAATLDEQLSAEELANVSRIDLRVGLLSNVEPVLMQNAFGAFQEAEGRFTEAELRVEVLPVIVRCDLCGGESRVENYKFTCGHCGRPTNDVIQGTELLIHRVHFANLTTT
jgi:hydrogenase nickel incorporation protein HypA/HybF